MSDEYADPYDTDNYLGMVEHMATCTLLEAISFAVASSYPLPADVIEAFHDLADTRRRHEKIKKIVAGMQP